MKRAEVHKPILAEREDLTASVEIAGAGKSWVDRDPLRKIRIVSGLRMEELVRVLREV